jgi:hypothetical protein
MVSDYENVTMLISVVVDILARELGIFRLKIGEKPRFFGIGNGTIYRYQLHKGKNRCFLWVIITHVIKHAMGGSHLKTSNPLKMRALHCMLILIP